MSDNTTHTLHYPSDYSTTSTRQRDTYMLIGFCFITLFLIAVFMAFVHRKCRKSSADAKQWFLGFCCAFRASRSSRISRVSVDLTASSGHLERLESQQEHKLQSITSYENPSYCELPEIPEEQTIEDEIKYENTTCLRAIPVFDTEDDSGISDVSTSPKYMELHSPREYFKYSLSGGKGQEQGTLIRVLLPENLKQFSHEELARYKSSPGKRVEVVNINRTLPNKKSTVYNVSADYKGSQPHRHKLRRASSDVTDMNRKHLYENMKRGHREYNADNDPVYQNLPAESVQTRRQHNYENVDGFYDLLHREQTNYDKQDSYHMKTGEQEQRSKRFKKRQEKAVPNRRSYSSSMHDDESQRYVNVMRHFSDQMHMNETDLSTLNVTPVQHKRRLTDNGRSYSTASESNTDELLLKLARNFFRHKEMYDKYYALDTNIRESRAQPGSEPSHYQNDILYGTRSGGEGYSPHHKRTTDNYHVQGEVNRAYSPDTIRNTMSHSDRTDRHTVSGRHKVVSDRPVVVSSGNKDVGAGSKELSRNTRKDASPIFISGHQDGSDRLMVSSDHICSSPKRIVNNGHKERSDRLRVSSGHIDRSPKPTVSSGHHTYRSDIPRDSSGQNGTRNDKANSIQRRPGQKNVTFQQTSKETSDHRIHKGRYAQHQQENPYVNISRS